MYFSKCNNHILIKVFKLLIIVGDLDGGVAIKCVVSDTPIQKVFICFVVFFQSTGRFSGSDFQSYLWIIVLKLFIDCNWILI